MAGNKQQEKEEKEFLERLRSLAGTDKSPDGFWPRLWQVIRHPNAAEKLGHHVFWEQMFSLAAQAVSPFAALRKRWLAATAAVQTGRSLSSKLQHNMHRTIQNTIYNNATKSLIEEAMEMPEIEREFKGRDLEKNLGRVADNVGFFFQSRFQKWASLVGIVGSSIAIASISPWLLGLGIPTYGLGRFFAKRKSKIQDRIFPYEYKARNNVWNLQDKAVRNSALHGATDDAKEMAEELDKAQAKYNEIVDVRRKKEEPLIWARIGAISAMVALALLHGHFIAGLDTKHLVALYAGLNAFLGSIGSWTGSSYSEKESLKDMTKHYGEFKHTKVFDLQTGEEKLPNKVDAIHLEFIKYSHRQKHGADRGKRESKPVLDFSSEVTFVPGINILGGASGAGKSTLYKLMRHADDLDRGSILFGTVKENGKFVGVPLTSMSLQDARKPIAFSLPELTDLESITGVELIRQGNPKLKKKSIERIAKLFKVPLWDEKGREKGMKDLSSGEKKRVLCASALVSPKQVIVLDEPTSGVDGANVGIILRQVNRLGKKKTIIYTTHQPESELPELDVVQVVDLDRKSTNEKGELLPTDVAIRPFNTEEEKRAYITLCNHREQGEKKDDEGKSAEEEADLIQILMENELLPDDVKPEEINEYLRDLRANETRLNGHDIYHAMKRLRTRNSGLIGRIRKLRAKAVVASAQHAHKKTAKHATRSVAPNNDSR